MNATQAPPLEQAPAGQVLSRLPYAIALLDSRGKLAWTNARYRELFDARLPEALAQLPCGGETRRLSLAHAGGAIEVLAYCQTTGGYRLLLLDETPGHVDMAVLQALEQQMAALEREAMLDRLTGAWNRRYLDRAFPAEVNRSRRHRHPLSAALIDIDHFKRVNDRFGHPAGDAVLRGLVALVRGCIREADSLVRWGGEEFLVLMPLTTHRMARAAAEKFRAAAARHEFPAAQRLTVSLGVGELLRDEAPDAFFARLDQALYRAKDGGRNRVVCDPRGASDEWAGEAPVVQLVWQESYRCGEAIIDAQHEELFALANALIAAGVDGRTDTPRFCDALERLLAHIARHFADEERILEAAGYARLAQHRDAHRQLLAQANAIKAQTLARQAGVGALVEFLAHEVVSVHLRKGDRDYYPLFAS